MCGIVGALSFGEADEKLEKLRKEVTSFLVTELLLLTVERGKDATGVAALFDNGDYMGLKMGIAAHEFVSRFGNTNKDYEGFLKVYRKNPRQCKVMLGHCRKSSIGNYWDNNNNHPIKVGDIVGIHNGTLTNHKKIIDKLECKKDGEVDSEAIFRLAHHLSSGGKDPFTLEMLYETAIRLDGTYAVLMFNGNNPYQVGAMRNSRPMDMVLIKPLKMIFIASEKKFLETALWRMNKDFKLYGADNLLYVESDDLDFQMMYDDHVAIFDLTREVKKDTKITELMKDKRIVVSDKKWQTGVVTTVNQYGYNRATGWNNKNTVNKPATEVNAEKETNKANTNKTETSIAKDIQKAGKVGMVWNRSLKEFEVAENTKDTDKIGNVQIEVEGGVVIEVGVEDKNITDTLKINKTKTKDTSENKTEDQDEIELEEVESGCEDLISDPAKVNEIAVKTIEKEKAAAKNKDDVAKKIEVDASEISFDAEALEKANEAVESLKKCEDEDDVVEQFQLENKSNLKAVPVHSLANRLKSFAYRLGFYDGYLKRKNEEKNLFGKTSVDEKDKKREKNIRVLKTMNIVLSRIIGDKIPGTACDRAIETEVIKALELKEEIESSIIREVFSAGDFRKEKVLRALTTTLENKEKRQ